MATKTDIRRDIRQLKRMLTDEQKAYIERVVAENM